MSSSNTNHNRDHALGLHGWIKIQPGRRICAAKGVAEYMAQTGIQRGTLKFRALCTDNPDLLEWTDDEGGQSWISLPPRSKHSAHSAPVASKASRNSAQLVSHSGSGTGGGSTAVATQMSGIFKGMQNLSVTTDRHNRQVVVSGEKEVKREVVREAVTVVPRFDVVAVIDISGSMTGAGAREVFTAVQELLKILKEDDSISIILFNGTIQEVLPLTKKKKVSFPACLPPSSYSTGSFNCGGFTSLWDAMGAGMTQLARRKISDKAPSHPHLVVLTDGEDTNSTQYNQSMMTEILKLPGDFAKRLGMANGACFGNFHATCISVGSDAATNFETMGKSNLHHVKATDANKIRDGFRAVTTYIERIRVTKQTVEVRMKEDIREITVAPYGAHAGRTKFDKTVKRDQFSNVVGPEYDLSPDDAFKGQRIVVLQLYSDASFTFAKPKAALERKGFAVDLYTHLPPIEEFTNALKRACQLWVISNRTLTMSDSYIPAIQKLVDLKKGLFLWGDNDPYNADANFILARIKQTSGLSLSGNYMGCQVLSEAVGERGWERPGFFNDKNKNLVFTGIESIYEGETIATINGPTSAFRSIMRASDGKVVTGVHDRDGARIMIDGGFTRLFETTFDRTAGTARFVTNSACWLYNFEGRVSGKKKPAEASSETTSDRGGGRATHSGGMTKDRDSAASASKVSDKKKEKPAKASSETTCDRRGGHTTHSGGMTKDRDSATISRSTRSNPSTNACNKSSNKASGVKGVIDGIWKIFGG